ncbi:MAG: hypothetical protein ACOX6H_02630 [Christensenellales bacterium]|jgi:hypothetical protein
MLVWAKTLLSVYRYLDRVADAIDKIVFSRAINSFYTSGSNLAFNSVESVTDDILNLTERKVNLINLKLIIKECLENTKPDLTPYLIANLIEGKTCFECVSIFNVSLRTYFRKINLALESFIKTLIRKGCDQTFFNTMLKDET